MSSTLVLEDPCVVPSNPSITYAQLAGANANTEVALRQTSIMQYARLLAQLDEFVSYSISVLENFSDRMVAQNDRMHRLTYRLDSTKKGIVPPNASTADLLRDDDQGTHSLKSKMSLYNKKGQKREHLSVIQTDAELHGNFLHHAELHPAVHRKYMNCKAKPDFGRLRQFQPDSINKEDPDAAFEQLEQSFAYIKRESDIHALYVSMSVSTPKDHSTARHESTKRRISAVVPDNMRRSSTKDSQSSALHTPRNGTNKTAKSQSSKKHQVVNATKDMDTMFDFFRSADHLNAAQKDSIPHENIASAHAFTRSNDEENDQESMGALLSMQKTLPMIRNVKLVVNSGPDAKARSRRPSLLSLDDDNFDVSLSYSGLPAIPSDIHPISEEQSSDTASSKKSAPKLVISTETLAKQLVMNTTMPPINRSQSSIYSENSASSSSPAREDLRMNLLADIRSRQIRLKKIKQGPANSRPKSVVELGMAQLMMERMALKSNSDLIQDQHPKHPQQ